MENDRCCGRKKECCSTGPEGAISPIGMNEDEVEPFKIVSETIKDFYEARLDLESPLSRDALAISIVRKIKEHYERQIT